MAPKTSDNTRGLLSKRYDKPGLFILVPMFVMPLVLGIGCMTESVPIEEGPAPTEEEPSPTNDGSIPFEVLREAASTSEGVISCNFNYGNINLDTVDQNEGPGGLGLVIDNPEDFSEYLTCADTVEIDFGMEFILAGMSTPQGNFPYVSNQAVRLSNGVLYYEVILVEGSAAQPGGASYAVKVLSRDYLEYPVVFDVRWEEPAPTEEEPAPTESGPVPFDILREARSSTENVFNCHFNFGNIVQDSSNTGDGLSGLELVIENSEDFANYLTCADTIHVDFSTEFVLAGKSAPQGNFPGIMGHTLRFLNDTLYYEVSLLQGIFTQPGSADYAVKVLSREYLKYPIVFDVYWAEEYRW